ncbi:MAG: hypothetical protein WC869_12460, partial [Phycisphaerae bacterium]
FLRLNPDFLVLIHRCLLMWIVNMRRYSDYSESARRICHTLAVVSDLLFWQKRRSLTEDFAGMILLALTGWRF